MPFPSVPFACKPRESRTVAPITGRGFSRTATLRRRRASHGSQRLNRTPAAGTGAPGAGRDCRPRAGVVVPPAVGTHGASIARPVYGGVDDALTPLLRNTLCRSGAKAVINKQISPSNTCASPPTLIEGWRAGAGYGGQRQTRVKAHAPTPGYPPCRAMHLGCSWKTLNPFAFAARRPILTTEKTGLASWPARPPYLSPQSGGYAKPKTGACTVAPK